MALKDKIQVFIKPDSFFAFLAARKMKVSSVAIVFGRTIHLYNTTVKQFLANKSWVLHELKHVEQYERYGKTKFLYYYLKECFQKGYYHNSLEVEARKAENDVYLLEKFEIVVSC